MKGDHHSTDIRELRTKVESLTQAYTRTANSLEHMAREISTFNADIKKVLFGNGQRGLVKTVSLLEDHDKRREKLSWIIMGGMVALVMEAVWRGVT